MYTIRSPPGLKSVSLSELSEAKSSWVVRQHISIHSPHSDRLVLGATVSPPLRRKSVIHLILETWDFILFNEI